MYVGHSINLYSSISSYFMLSILKTKTHRVLSYFTTHGFSNLKLTIYIMDINSNLDEVVALEQLYIDTLNPYINVNLISYSGYQGSMSHDIEDKLCKERGTPVYIYDSETFN